MKISAVVVTYNRLALLQECIAALRAQSLPPSEILVINNDATDGTTQWLAQQGDLRVVHQANQGGAFGFYTGIREAYAAGADWVWLMDDDTIPTPEALATLVQAVKVTREAGDNIGYLGSNVRWTDGSAHQANLPVHDHHFQGHQTEAWYRQQGLEPLMLTTFVSFFVSRQAIEKVGLPLKEMFIWFDDREYVFRLRKAGFRGMFVPESKVLHKTPVNVGPDLLSDQPRNLWKHRYGIRNDLYVRRHYKSFGSFVRNACKYFLWQPLLIAGRRRSDHWPFIRTVWQAAWEGLWFNPAPEGVMPSANRDNAAARS